MFRDDGSGVIGGRVPEINAERNLSMYRALTKAMSQGLVASAHDCSDGGLAVALAECCFGTNSGAVVNISELGSSDPELDSFGALFSESMGRILVSVRPEDSDSFSTAMKGHSCHKIGSVEKGDNLSVSRDDEPILSASVSNLKQSWQGSLGGGHQ